MIKLHPIRKSNQSWCRARTRPKLGSSSGSLHIFNSWHSSCCGSKSLYRCWSGFWSNK